MQRKLSLTDQGHVAKCDCGKPEGRAQFLELSDQIHALVGGRAVPLVDVRIYHLEMLAPSHRTVSPPREGLFIVHAQKPSVAYYRFLYAAVGKDYHWFSRGCRPDAELAALIQDPLDEVHVLHADGAPAGFAELDRRKAGEIELVQFGLMPEFIGQGL